MIEVRRTRGTKRPVVPLVISNMAEAAGAAPVAFIPTFWACATVPIRRNKKTGKKGKINHISLCDKTISVKFKEPTGTNKVKIIILIETS